MIEETDSQSNPVIILTVLLIVVLVGVFWLRIRPQPEVDKIVQATATTPQNAATPAPTLLPSKLAQIDPNTSPLAIFEQSPPPTPWPIELKHYDGWELGYSFDYPADWIFSDIEGTNWFEFRTHDNLNYLFGDFSGNDEIVQLYLMPSKASQEWDEWVARIGVSPNASPVEILAAGISPFGQEYEFELMGEIQSLQLADFPAALVTYHITNTYNIDVVNPQFDITNRQFDALQAIMFLPDQVLHIVVATASGQTGNALNELRVLINSFEPVDYSGWQQWQAPDSSIRNEIALAYPPTWDLQNQAENPNILNVLLTQGDASVSGASGAVRSIHVFKYVGINASMSEAEAEQLWGFYTDREDWTEIEPITRLRQNPLATVGVFQADDGIVLLGTVDVFVAGPRKSTNVLMRIAPDELEEMRPIFERVLRSIRPKSAPPLFESE